MFTHTLSTETIDSPICTPTTPHKIIIFTDGAATKNGKTNCLASWAFVIFNNISREKIYEARGMVEATAQQPATNNRGELIAITRALEYIHNKNIYGLTITYVTIVSDSAYSIGCINVWASGWRKKNICDKKNLDIVFEAYDLLCGLRNSGVTVTFQHIRSHKRAPSRDTSEYFLWYGNNSADKLCTSLIDDLR